MFKSLLRYTRNVFNFTFAEAKGFLAMAGMIAGLSIFFLLYDATPSDSYTSFREDQEVLDSMVAAMESRFKEDSETTPVLSAESRERKIKFQYFFFNPNQLPLDSLLLLGIPVPLARRIENYRQKGGIFRKEEDLLKIYGFPDSLYYSLEPYISLSSPFFQKEQAKPAASETKGNSEAKAAKSFNINKADSLQFQRIKGIGPVLSSRLVRFRDKLGGFVHLNQLYEVYGLDTAVVQKLTAVAFIEKGFVPNQIRLNLVSQEQLDAHPYISPGLARLILAYRTEHGPLQGISDLSKIHTLEPEIVEKIAPYINFD